MMVTVPREGVAVLSLHSAPVLGPVRYAEVMVPAIVDVWRAVAESMKTLVRV